MRSALALAIALLLSSCAAAPTARLSAPAGAASDFLLTDQNGGLWDSEKLKGETYLVDFWATWCAPCVASVPDLNRFQERHASQVKLLGVALDEKGWDLVRPFIAKHGVKYPVSVGTGALAAAYGVEGLPSLLLVSKGKVEKRMLGRHSLDEIEKELAPYLH